MDVFLQLMLLKVIFFLPLLTILVASLAIMLIAIKTKKMSSLAKVGLVVIFCLISLLMAKYTYNNYKYYMRLNV